MRGWTPRALYSRSEGQRIIAMGRFIARPELICCADGETASYTRALASRQRSHKEFRHAAARHAVPQRRTKIDYLEKVAQLYYAVSLLAFPENWLNEQFQDKSLANSDAVLALMSIMGLLVLTIIVITFIIRNAKNTRAELMKKMDLAAAGCWSFFLVNSIRLMNDGIFEDAAFKQNCGIYSVIIAAYAYQSTTRKPKSK